MPRLKQVTVEKYNRAKELISQGKSIDEACREVTMNKNTFYRCKKILEGNPAQVQIHELSPSPERPKPTPTPRPKETPTRGAVFVGDIASCVKFMKEFE